MRILFLSTNRFRIELVQPMPIGLACVIGAIEESEHVIEVLDLMFAEDPAAELAARLEEFQPEMVAVSIRNTDNLSYVEPQYFLPEAKQMIELCRSASGAKIVVGGAAFTSVPLALFDYLEPDFGIAGEGEVSFPRLLEWRSRRERAGATCPAWSGASTVRSGPTLRASWRTGMAWECPGAIYST